MKAIRVEEFGEPEVMQFVELPDLQISAGEILVQIQAAGVNPVDTYIRAGTYARKPQLPYTPGSDGAGVVAAVGSEEAISSLEIACSFQDRCREPMPRLPFARRIRCILFRRSRPLPRAPRLVCLMRRLIAHCSIAARCAAGRRCWFTGRAAASAPLPCNSRAAWTSGCLAQRVLPRGANWCASSVRT